MGSLGPAVWDDWGQLNISWSAEVVGYAILFYSFTWLIKALNIMFLKADNITETKSSENTHKTI